MLSGSFHIYGFLFLVNVCGRRGSNSTAPFDEVYDEEYHNADRAAEYNGQDSELESAAAYELPEAETDGSADQ